MRPSPSTDRFVRDINATLKHHFLNFTQDENDAKYSQIARATIEIGKR
ncbi:hypothetical protein CES85_3472 (plasmid) [Ochrobactrum quorumnocens]|uniref:Uncharacterized protein n=1 Tax=Ochrobactrum quorumnocens TaxID=271865 RepID=A0A248UNT8_9HYPH|nr:hypothetical protein CES85_3472 [[Ochrobactrum] quorumnocens]